MFCPACGYENLPGVDFCEECLSSLGHLDLKRSPKTESRIEKAILKERVYQINSPASLSVNPNTSLQEVIDLMIKNSKTAVVVENNNSEIVGIFTERSFVRRVAKNYPANKNDPISNFMAKNPVILHSTDKTVNALHLMFVAGYSYAIIDEKPPRILSIIDIIKYVIELYPSLAGFNKLLEELKNIALVDGVITEEEAKILKKVEEKKDNFLRIFARIESSGTNLIDSDKEILEEIINEFIPSIEEIASGDHHISTDEAQLLRKLMNFFEENKERLLI
jgi:signal-transduction protein with cAMP-binding, CBS, and nucleotidyltransferase domain